MSAYMMGEIDLGIEGLSDYQVIGRGGFSTIYSAHDEGFNRRVAVKLLHSLDDAGRRRFERERGIMGQLSSHPNVIMPFRAGYTHTGAPYLVMELVLGGSLQEILDQRGPIPWAEAVEYVVPVAAALGHAHEQGILHRDVKPANVVLAGRVPKLTDFGIAAIRESTTTQVAYTLAHCPPEAFASGADTRDERSDLYSLASLLHNLITGRPPYHLEGPDSPHAYMFRIMQNEAPPIAAELVPPPLQAFIQAGLAKDAALRPQNAREFEEALRSIAAAYSPGTITGPAAAGAGGRWVGTGPDAYWTGQPSPDISTDETIISPQPAGPGQSGPGISRPQNPLGASTTGGQAGDTGRWPGSPGPAISGPGTSGPGTSGPGVAANTGEHPLVGAPTPKRRSALVAAAVAAVMALAVMGGGAYWWLQVRGGSSEPELAWTFNTRSSLASMPAVADGTLVIGAHVTNKVHAVDTETGLALWEYETGGSVDASPAIADGVVYIGSDDGSMYALELSDGSLVWTENIGNPLRAGALVTDGTVVFGDDAGSIWGLDVANGTQLWTAKTNGAINSTPAAVTRSGRSLVVIGSTDGSVYFLDPATGEEVERVALEGGVWFSRPLVLDQLDDNGDPTGSQEVWIGSSLAESGFLNRIDADTGQFKSFANRAGVGTAPAVTSEGYIIAGNDRGELFAVDRVSLGEVWRHGYANENQIKGSPVVWDDQVVFGTHDKQLIGVDAETGSELWHFDGQQIFGLSAPVVVDGELFVGNDSGAVYRFDL